MQSTPDFLSSRMRVNVGPSHPATHGTLRFIMELEGEKIIKCTPEIGYLHRAFEKSAEKGTYTQVIPYTDRLNYCSAMINNVGYVMAVEHLMGLKITERCRYIRVIISELSRIMDHLVCIGACAVDLGALTNFWYFFEKREEIYDVLESLCGARLTTSYTRIGGLMHDAGPDFVEGVNKIIKSLPAALKDVDGLLTNNRIFYDRTRGVGVISKEDALSYSFTGPCLRASGVGYDVRKASPYLVYDNFEFDVPTDGHGDAYSRYLVRMQEMRESIKIIEQAVKKLPGGPVNAENNYVTLPDKQKVYSEMEALIRQFKIIIDGVKPQVGETYFAVEGANGELGFYIVSDGGTNPYRVRVRPPCFPFLAAFPKMVEGHYIADAISALGSLNIIAGELDR
ncbi:MAG TPA: NADH dehydrogenase (quinone) subunit D [Candidatus Wallbacteria bacterium]|nr:NADH dehydrogenase (quinone) subunit D [Candidatus Wallbacteria bacterium]